MNAIITRDPSGFMTSPIPVFTPEAFLTVLGSKENTDEPPA